MKFSYTLDDRGLAYFTNAMLIPENQQDIKLLSLLQDATRQNNSWGLMHEACPVYDSPCYKGGPLHLAFEDDLTFRPVEG